MPLAHAQSVAPGTRSHRHSAERSRHRAAGTGPHRGRPNRTDLRRLATAVVGPSALLLANAVLVSRHSAGPGPGAILLDGEAVYVREDGPPDAPALVLIHGLASSSRIWDDLLPALARSHRVVRIDLLGHGSSGKPRAGSYRIVDQARRVGRAMDRLGVDRATVIGHSSGGMVATALAEQRRDRVAALALIDTGPDVAAFRSHGPIGDMVFAPVIGQLIWRLRSDALIRRAASTAVSRVGLDVPQQMVDDVRATTYRAFTATSRAAHDYLAAAPVPERLTALGLPLLVMFGTDDRRWRATYAARAYRAVPDARVELLPGIGHSPTVEAPGRTRDLLTAFLARRA